jgi:hypothetical protein
MRYLSLLFVLFPFASTVGASPLAVDEPQRGEWDFAPQKIWEVNRAGDTAFGRPAELRVAADGTLYCHDFDQQVSHIFAPDGAYLGAFAPQGDGPGEVSHYLNCFLAGKMVVIGTPTDLHFFTREGAFVRAAANDIFSCFPLVFLSDQVFLCAPGELTNAPEGIARIRKVDLGSGSVEILDELPPPVGDPVSGGPPVVVRGLTPVVELAYDPVDQELYYGRSDTYALRVVDLDGHRLRTFGLNRPRRPVSTEEKREHFAPLSIPPEHVNSIVASLPDKLTHFHRIRVHEGLVYVFVTTGLGRRPQGQEIDIFSADGTYLYRARITFAAGQHIFSSPENLALNGEDLCVILEDDAGQTSIAKYRLRLPPSPRRR